MTPRVKNNILNIVSSRTWTGQQSVKAGQSFTEKKKLAAYL